MLLLILPLVIAIVAFIADFPVGDQNRREKNISRRMNRQCARTKEAAVKLFMDRNGMTGPGAGAFNGNVLALS